MNKGPQHLSLWPREHVGGACAPTSLYLCVWCVLVCVPYVLFACEHECWTCMYKCVLGNFVCSCVHICMWHEACVLHVRGLRFHTQMGKIGTAGDGGGHGGMWSM